MSQGATVLPTTGTFTGLTEQGYINSALAALLTNNSGASAPSSPSQWQFWLDTSTSGYGVLRLYDGADWLKIAVIDLTNHVLGVQSGGGVGANIASAATTDLWSITNPGALITITGTTTITALANASGSTPAIPGTRRKVTFAGALGLTHNATSLILPNAGANITTAAGDVMEVLALTSGHVLVTDYQRASGAPLNAAGLPVLLNTLTASNSASLTDTTSITNAYSRYQFEFCQLVPATAGLALQMQVQVGGSWISAGYYGHYDSAPQNGIINNAAQLQLTPPDVNNGTPGISGLLQLYYGSSSAADQQVAGQLNYASSGHVGTASVNYAVNFAGYCAAGAVTGVQFLMASGNLASGSIKIFGTA